MSSFENTEQLKALARTLARKVQEYFRDPKHREEYEEWKKERLKNGESSTM